MADPELTPNEETRVRALLAAARHDEPIPGDVADRLDRVLAGLAACEPAGVTEPHDELAARRRRRVRTLLVAAAVVVLGGVGIARLAPVGDDGDEGSTAADTSGEVAASPSVLEDAPLSAWAERDQDAGGAADRSVAAPAPEPATARPLEVRPDRFAADAVRALALGERPRRAVADAEPYSVRAAWFTCDPAPWGAGELVAVRYEGEPAVLAFRAPAGETRVVDLLACGTAEVLRSATLPLS